MRLPCEIVFMKMSSGNRQNASNSKRGFAVLQKISRNPPKYQIKFAVANDKTNNKFELDKRPTIICSLKAQGKVTFTFQSKPPVSVLLSKADPENLNKLLELIERICKGENVDLQDVQIKTADFKPASIHIKSREEYTNRIKNVSEFLKTLKIDPINLQMADPKWSKCHKLTQLTLSGNAIGAKKQNLNFLQNFKNLEVLELKNCSLGSLDKKSFFDFFTKTPRSLTTLDISENSLTIFPPIFHLLEIRRLNISSNHLRFIPSRIGFFSYLIKLDVSRNQMTWLPNVFRRLRHFQEFSFSENPQLIRDENQLVPILPLRLFTKIDNLSYTYPGGVDSLFHIAANALHRDPLRFPKCREFLPLCARFRMDDLLHTTACLTSMELCTSCLKLRHIRYIVPSNVPTVRMSNTVDIVNRFVVMNETLCVDCFRVTEPENVRIEPDFFKFSI